MTISLAWIKRNIDSVELIFAADSRLRSRGAMDQTQKILRLDRGDCCLGFCGDTQIAYPMFIQVATTLNNHITTRTHAMDVTKLGSFVGELLNSFVESWDLDPSEKAEELKSTRVLFGGWSWLHKRFDVGVFRYENGGFEFHHEKTELPHPWKEKHPSLVFIGDYKSEYLNQLASVLDGQHPRGMDPHKSIKIDLRYEPVQALHNLLRNKEGALERTKIGGAPQIVKVYAYGNSLPIVVRTEPGAHFLLGRRLFAWEKTEYPIIDMSAPVTSLIYPLRQMPLPVDLKQTVANDDVDVAGSV